MKVGRKIPRAIASVIAGAFPRHDRKGERLLRGSRYFQAEYYARQLPSRPRGPLERHFNEAGWRLGLNPSPFFDVMYYLFRYPDVRRAKVNPLLHYLRDGWKERRSPHPAFEAEAFLKDHEVLESAEIDLADYCIRLYGSLAWGSGDGAPVASVQSVSEVNQADLETVRNSKYFDPGYYLSMYPDVAETGFDPALHYLLKGWREHRNPSAEFDTNFYTGTNDDGGDGTCPLLHFLSVGRKEGRLPRSANAVTMEPSASPPPMPPGLKIAVHAHIFYTDVIEELVLCLGYLPPGVHVLFTVLNPTDRRFVERVVRRRLPDLDFEVRIVPNRGRDIAPMLVGARDLWEAHDVVCHLHTKRSPHTNFGDDWRHYVFDQLMGSRDRVLDIVEMFRSDPGLGMLYPENYFRIAKFVKWGDSEARIRDILREIGSPRRELPRTAEFAASSMAWYRSQSIAALFRRFSSVEDFETEDGQIDSTMAHVVERVLPLVVQAAGARAVAFHCRRREVNAYSNRLHGRDAGADPVGSRWRRDTPAIMRNRSCPTQPLTRVFDGRSLAIDWIIPNFVRGAGGHMTIFRMVELLAEFGHRQTIWVQNARDTPSVIKNRIRSWYRPIPESVIVRFLPDDVRQLGGDAVIATDCWTAYPAAAAPRFKARFYLIQDYEPAFHPCGDLQLAAEATYRMGFAALCAGDWLLEKARGYGMWARKWELAADKEHYFPDPSDRRGAGTGAPLRIAFYARSYTPRRAVDLGVAALEELAARGVDFTAHMFGEDAPRRHLGFKNVQRGILSPSELGELFRSADIGLVFSMTNYSIIPLEMMACRLPVVEIDGESTRAVFANGEVQFAAPAPQGIADAIQRLVGEPAEREAQTARAAGFVDRTEWRSSARAIEAAIVERLEALGNVGVDPEAICAPMPIRTIAASVFIPTYKAGADFGAVLERVSSQVTDFRYEVLAIDSGSGDGTVEKIQQFKDRGVRLHTIPNSEFQHGRTRNLGIAMTEGAHVALITQDALPADAHWLAALIGGFGRSNRVGGVTGRHLAYPAHGPFLARDLTDMFDRFAEYPEVYSLESGLPSHVYRGGSFWRMVMHFYSDNNSALARAVWKEIPYPEIDWGEDAVWAWEMLKAGFEKVYVDEARIFHSHPFVPEAHRKVSVVEGKLFKEQFGYSLYGDEEGVRHAIEAANRHDEAYARAHGISAAELRQRKEYNRVTIEGRFAGAQGARDDTPRGAGEGRGGV